MVIFKGNDVNILGFTNSCYYNDMAYFTDKKDFLLKEYVDKQKTIVEIGNNVGVAYSTVQRGLEEHGIETNKSRGGKWKRSNAFVKEMRERLKGKKYAPKTAEIRDKYRAAAIKRHTRDGYNYNIDKIYKSQSGLKNAMIKVYGKSECYECGWKEHPEILHVHHKDMDHSNNKLSNCIWLCPNCHSLIHYRKSHES